MELSSCARTRTIVLGLAMLIAGCPGADDRLEPLEVRRIYWSDGDSGRIDGTPFRLAGVDAPETGGVGARGGAQCEAERSLGFAAKTFMVALMDTGSIWIGQRHGTDRYGRLVVDLRIDGRDLARAGVAAGHLASWPHRGQRALALKPSWCKGL